MMVFVLALGAAAVMAAGVGLMFSRRTRQKKGGSPQQPKKHMLNPKQQQMSDLFSARLRSGGIGIPDLVRLLKNEGHGVPEISFALGDAMSKIPQLAGRKDKLDAWLKEGEREV